MYLKRLTCHGFKSFADKTVFDFLPGVTGIVGPNGCGKSNVVDAIKWVLGDQSPRSLRGKQMLDVVFNGSGTRKGAGMAQVDLCFDNADRKLACDSEEVVISRRLFRSGESDYLINNESVRLRDVRELFMDTGVGVGAYSIIEQGKVDILLQANPQERRVIFEEAAGISRYKARKKEAERKLARVEQNLLRLEDIIEEVEKRLRSVKYQAGKARNWQEYDQQLREKRATYSLSEYHRLVTRKGSLSGEEDRLSDEETRLRTAIDAAEVRIATLEGETQSLDAEIRRIDHQSLNNAADITANHERTEAARQRMTELAEVRTRAWQRLAVERRRAARLREQIETESAGITQLDGDIQAARQTVDTLGEEDRQLGQERNRLENARDEEKAAVIEAMRQTAQLNNQVQSLNQRREQLETEKGRLQTRGAQIGAELSARVDEKDRLDARGEEIAARIRDQNAQLEAKQQEAARVDARRAELNQQIAAAKEYKSGLVSRRALLSDLDRQMEGVDAGVRELLHRKEQDPTGQTFGYVLGMVADLIAADVANATLIETALGDHDQDLVVVDSRAFFNDADVLGDFPGRVNAVCLDRLPPFIDGRDFSQQEGFVACAMDLVRYSEQAERLVRHLLGKTIIVRTFEDALRMAGQNPPGYSYVTLSGQLLDPNGWCRLGPAGGRAGLISRKSELRDIASQIGEVDGRIARMSEQLEQTSADMARLDEVQRDLRAAVYDARTAEVENNAARANAESAIQRLRDEQPLIDGEIGSIDAQIRDAAQRAAQHAETLTVLERENADREARVRELDARIEEVGRRRTQLAERLTEARVAVGELTQRRNMLADRLRALRESQQASDEAVRASALEAEDTDTRIAQAERQILVAGSRLAELFADKERFDREAVQARDARERLRREVELLSARIRADRTTLHETEERLHRLQMELQEVRIRLDELVARTREELSIDLARSYADYQHREDQDWAALEAEIEELKGKIRRLGNVNLDAIAEQEELEKRSSFLGGQHDDLRKSRRQLEELIEELNQECRQRFTETFEAVRGHFHDLFRKLFGGGKADIMLEQPPEGQPLDVLEAGIDIQARPPGKELQNIQLMSGGEKTLTAIALVLAIFRSRPSPFAVLDEVDAALDEANNERFNRIVQEFLEHSQFIIITHSKRTMTIANMLYGVTMQEAGVSKRVSVKFEGNEPSAAVA